MIKRVDSKEMETKRGTEKVEEKIDGVQLVFGLIKLAIGLALIVFGLAIL